MTEKHLELKDTLGLYPPAVRKIIIALDEQKQAMLANEQEILTFRKTMLWTQITELKQTNKEFCDQFYLFLQKQNEEIGRAHV